MAWSTGWTVLDPLPGGNYSQAYGVSRDGSVVVGVARAADGTNYPVYWTDTPPHQPVSLGSVGPGTNGYAWGISADGSTIVGFVWLGPGVEHPFYWTSASGIVQLPIDGRGYACSADGSIVVGTGSPLGITHGFYWTGGVTTDLPPATPGQFVFAPDVSDDGSVVSYMSDFDGVRWTPGGGPVVIGSSLLTYAVSGDGITIVGQGADNTPYRWTALGGFESLGSTGGAYAAVDATPDGSIIAGYGAAPGLSNIPFLWTAATGISYLPRPVGYETYEVYANAVNGDGSIVVAYAQDGNYRGMVYKAAPAAGVLTVAQVGIRVQRNLSMTINHASLAAAADPAVTTDKLQYTLNGHPAYGTLYLRGVPITTGATFTQQDIDNSLLVYVQNDDTATADSFPYTCAVLP